jgi:predicted DNA-binding transcriptional regulator AlpA
MTEKELLTINELAEHLGVHRCTITKLQKKTDFPKPIMILTQKKWKRSEIDAYLEKTREVADE